MTDFSRYLADLRPDERELLEKLLAEQAAEFNTFPLSFAQQRLWFLDQLEPGSALYNMPAAVRLTGSLDVSALEESINEVVRRHEALRTTFAMIGGRPIQVITPALSISFPVVDLTDHKEESKEAQALSMAGEEAITPFDLTSGPLLRAKLLRLTVDQHILLLTMHHIVSDAWSLNIFVRELASLYNAFSSSSKPSLPDLPLQYADYAVWQREWLQGETLETALAYWKEQLSGAPSVLELPTDRPRPAKQTFTGARYPLEISSPLMETLKALSQREGATLFMTLLAAFKVLLYRYSGQEDVLVGTTVANRGQSEIEELVGFFVNAVPLRTDLSGNPTFREVLRRVRAVTSEAYAYQDLPFEKLVEELHPARDLSYTPLFQVVFAFQSPGMPSLQLRGLRAEQLEIHSGTAKFDLTFNLEESTEGQSGAKGWIEYNTDLFDASTIARMAEHFQVLLQSIVASPDQGIATLPMLTKQERHKFLTEWSSAGVSYEQGDCLHQLLEQRAEQTPNAIAVTFEEHQLTYDELNRRANQLAHYLTKLGVGPEVRVGICVERSLEMIVGLLGILKAGGAYVPLDPAYPSERLAFMIEDAGIQVLLTQKQLLASVPRTVEQIICLDADWAAMTQESDENPISQVGPYNLAYVIYTSGSTGKPKGVLVTHYNVVRLFQATEKWFNFDEHDVWTLFHSYAFDFSVWELWGALLYGGRIVVVPYWVSRSPKFSTTSCAQSV